MAALKLKPTRAPVPLEKVEQANFFAWLRWQKYDGMCLFDHAFAIPNGSYLHGTISQRAMQSNALKQQGVKNGVPDVAIPIPVTNPDYIPGIEGRRWFHGLWLEFKRSNGTAKDVSDDQGAWHTRLRSNGYAVYVVYGCDQAMAVVREYFGLGGA